MATGYPSIDKPWMKYYSEEAINAELPKGSIYEYLWENNKSHFDDVALIYFHRKITYRELFENIDKTAAAFSALGVSKGDIVTIQALSLPQVIYMLYALSKLGAISNLIYATLNAKEIAANLKETKSKIYVTIDSIFHSFDIDIEGLEKVILLSVEDEMNIIAKAAYKLTAKTKVKKKRNNILSWKSFMSLSSSEIILNCSTPRDPVIMVYTGGTTGKSKAVMLSNFNLNIGALQYLPLGFERHKRFLCVLPPFIAFGLIVTVHMPLVFGCETVLGISMDPTEISGFVETYEPNYIICGTAQAEKMMNALKAKKTDLSCLTLLGVGGDALPISLENSINKFLLERNSKTRIIQGYAMSETSASSTAAIHTIHKQGTVGIPFVYTTVKIVDTNTNMELSYGETGEICINAPCVMIGYYQNEEETNSILRRHSDGKIWVHTGDIGSMDEDGFITIVGRMKRMVLVSENSAFHKIFPKLIEDVLLKADGIKAISIVGKPHKEKTNELIAFVVLDERINHGKAMDSLEKLASSRLESYECPAKYVIVEALPLTTVGKVDYLALEKIAAGD